MFHEQPAQLALQPRWCIVICYAGLDRPSDVEDQDQSPSGRQANIRREINVRGVSGDIRLAGDFDSEDDGEISTLSGGIQLSITDYKRES